jgi:hypothetical protein
VSDESFLQVAEMARRIKLDQLHSGKEWVHFVVAMRADEPVAIVYAGPPPTGHLEAIYWTALCLQPEEMFYCADTYQRMLPIDADLSGLRRGQLEKEWEAGNKENTTEAILIARQPYIGPPSAKVYPYHSKSNKLAWDEPMDITPGDQYGGDVVQAGRDGLAEGRVKRAAMMDKIKDYGDVLGIPGPMRTYHIDAAMCSHISGRTKSAVTLMYSPDPSYPAPRRWWQGHEVASGEEQP